MGATEEQMTLIAGSSMDGVAYLLILYSLAFLVFLFAMVLINVYDRAANPPVRLTANGHARGGDEARLHDANEFELDGLVSDDEDDERAARRKLLAEDGVEQDASLGSPSTVGRNSDRLA